MRGRNTAIRALLRNDLRKLSRDPVLLAGAFAPLMLAAALAFGLPRLEQAAAQWIDLAAHRATIVAGALAVTSMLAGWIVGFMLLEERAQRMIPALAVTPLTRRGFVSWRLVSPTALALLGGLLVLLAGGGAALGLGRALLAWLLMAGCAPLFALALVSAADNEVEGLALAKFGALVFMLPLVSAYLDGPVIWLAALLPPFWPMHLLTGGDCWMASLGLLVIAAWAVVLLRRLDRRID